MDDLDSRVRLAAFQFLAEQVARHPDTLPYEVLQRGFDFEGHRVPLIGPQGIFKPAILPDMPLSILHHAAFDRYLLGIRPDLTVELRVDILRERDGPTLQHGLLRFQGTTITVPRRPESRPNPEFLAERYELFRKAG